MAIKSGLTITLDLDTGLSYAKFEMYTVTLPSREELAGEDLEDLSLSLLSEAISYYARGDADTAPERLQQGLRAVRQLKTWLEQYRETAPTICAECSQQM